jgi:two-component system phosphate regulon sensor histidine kinase PhoR
MWSKRLFGQLLLVYFVLIAALALLFLLTAAVWTGPSNAASARNSPSVAIIWSLWGVAAVLLAAAHVAAYFTLVRIFRPLNELARAAQSMAAGGDERATPTRTRDEVGQLSRAFAEMQQEVTRRIERLESTNDRMVTVLGSMDEGIIAVDAKERILLANNASRRLLEFSAIDAAGRPLLEVTRSRHVHEAVGEALRTGKAAHRDFETTGAKRRWLTLRAACLPGTPTPGVVVVLRDVTELRRLENLRRELVANVSHELKTPLSSIKAYAETLRLGAMDDPENNLAFILRIEDQADRLHQLILDMIQIARVEAGEETFEIVDVPLDEMIESCLATYADSAAARNIILQAHAPRDPLHVRADDEGLSTILNNLVDNAIKYTSAGGSVSVAWRANGDSAVIEVIDTGIGIAKEDQSRVFERFYRVDRARSRELGGTGLGLSIVKHLVQAFGGTVGIESELGRGSTFRLRLPRA